MPCPWRKQLHDTIYFSKNLEMACCAVGIHSRNSNIKILECLGFSLRTDSYSYWWKPNIQSTSLCFEWSLVKVTLCLHLPLGLMHYMETYVKCLEEVELPWIKRVATGRPTSSYRTLPYAKQAGEPSFGCYKISAITSLLTSGHSNTKIAIPLIIMWGTIEQTINKTLRHTKDELKARIMATFADLDKESFKKACWQFQSSGDHGWNLWWFLLKNSSNSISRYFSVILVNISDKRRSQCYFHFCII